MHVPIIHPRESKKLREDSTKLSQVYISNLQLSLWELLTAHVHVNSFFSNTLSIVGVMWCIQLYTRAC